MNSHSLAPVIVTTIEIRLKKQEWGLLPPENLLNAWHCAQHVTCLLALNTQSHLLKQVLLLFPLYHCWNQMKLLAQEHKTSIQYEVRFKPRQSILLDNSTNTWHLIPQKSISWAKSDWTYQWCGNYLVNRNLEQWEISPWVTDVVEHKSSYRLLASLVKFNFKKGADSLTQLLCIMARCWFNTWDCCLWFSLMGN